MVPWSDALFAIWNPRAAEFRKSVSRARKNNGAVQQRLCMIGVECSQPRKDRSLRDINEAIGSFREQRRKWEGLLRSAARTRPSFSPPASHSPASHLVETRSFGANPGALRMFTHVPKQMSPGRALVVVLHGCTQNASSYDLGAGWSTLADRLGFALLFPEQQRFNNPNACFNWFQAGDIERGQGEALSIRQMVERAVSDHAINPAHIYVTGLSAGGAMTSVMLATYPEVFAGGAIIAGLPYRAAIGVQQAFETMFQCPQRPAREWGNLVRSASTHQGPWPRISVWHGGSDATVIPPNAQEIVKQWTNVHGLPEPASVRSIVDGYPRKVWLDAAGEEIIESYTIPGMAHGTPLATGDALHECGASGPFLLDVGFSSSYHIAKFFGLTGQASAHVRPNIDELLDEPEPHKKSKATISVQPYVHVGEVLGPEADEKPSYSSFPPPPMDINAVITKALRAAGLMKGS